jgi:hypothetical protein
LLGPNTDLPLCVAWHPDDVLELAFDPQFRARLRRIIEEDQELLERLAK